jgi:hypothetical protein
MQYDPTRGLFVPGEMAKRQCGACGGQRFWIDIKNVVHCWDCVPPQALAKRYKEHLRKQKQQEASAVNDFIEEDIDIQDFNERKHGVRTS